MKKIITCIFLLLFIVSCSSSEVDDSSISEGIRRNLNDSITELVFPDINICRKAIYKKTSESEKEKQRSICNKMKDNLLATSANASKIKKYYNASILEETKRKCIFDLWFRLGNEGTFATDEEMEQCIK